MIDDIDKRFFQYRDGHNIRLIRIDSWWDWVSTWHIQSISHIGRNGSNRRPKCEKQIGPTFWSDPHEIQLALNVARLSANKSEIRPGPSTSKDFG